MECGTKRQLFSTRSDLPSPKDVAYMQQSGAKRQLFCVIPSTSKQVSQVQRASGQQLFGTQSDTSSMSDGVHRHQNWHLGLPSSLQEPSTTKESPLSVPVDSFCSEVVVQEHVLEAIWRKAGELLKEDGSITIQRRFGNVCYHCNVACILSRYPGFTPAMLVIPPAILVQLLPVHTTFLQTHMPGRLASQ